MKLAFWRPDPVPVIILHGLIAARVGALNIAAMAGVIDRAFDAAQKIRHVVLDIDSPGGSPVQSDLIATRIRRRAEADGVRVHAVIGDAGASGGYWLACAADEIIANPMSIVGSIGVVGGGFGFEDAISRLGVRRRLYTAGLNKARLDPFSPERPEDVAFVHALMDDIHARFKDWVRLRRAGKLPSDEAALFDGSFFLGARAKDLGLIDRFGDVDGLVEELAGKGAKKHEFRPRRRGMLSRLRLAGRALAEAAIDVAEERQGPRLGV